MKLTDGASERTPTSNIECPTRRRRCAAPWLPSNVRESLLMLPDARGEGIIHPRQRIYATSGVIICRIRLPSRVFKHHVYVTGTCTRKGWIAAGKVSAHSHPRERGSGAQAQRVYLQPLSHRVRIKVQGSGKGCRSDRLAAEVSARAARARWGIPALLGNRGHRRPAGRER